MKYHKNNLAYPVGKYFQCLLLGIYLGNYVNHMEFNIHVQISF